MLSALQSALSRLLCERRRDESEPHKPTFQIGEDETEIAAASRALFDEAWSQRLRFVAKELRYTLIGGFFALSGLAAFLSQSRDNYYLAHSAWHVTVMSSTYFFVAGRAAAIRNAKGLVHRLLNNDA